MKRLSETKSSNFKKANSQLKKLPTKKKTDTDRKALLSYLSNKYGITYFNKTFVYKLEHIHNGTLQNLQVPITYDILLNMFEYYRHELEKQSVYNKQTGKKFSDIQGALNYDLAIILSKHSDYLDMLEKDKARSVELVQPQFTAKMIQEVKKPKSENSKGEDISQMLNDW